MKAYLLSALLAFATPVMSADETIRVFGWYDYVSVETLKKIEAETGIKVQYDTFDSAEILETKLMTGRSGYDVVFPGISMLSRLLQAKALQPTGMGEMRSAVEMDKELLTQPSCFRMQ
jgi:putrescine transport system substrate-binding protein